MRRITIKHARTWHYGKMRPCIEQSNALAPLSPFRSWLDCTTNTSGYDFRKDRRGDCDPMPKLIPACETLITMHLTSSSEGRFSRRREAGRGAVSPRVGLRRPDTRGGAGLPPGPLRGPARSWLTTLRPTPNASGSVDMVRAGKRGKERRKRGRRTDSRRNGTPRGARASFAGRDTIGLRLSALHPPHARHS